MIYSYALFEKFKLFGGAKALYRDNPFKLEHRPKPMPGAAGICYYVAHVLYAFSLFIAASGPDGMMGIERYPGMAFSKAKMAWSAY